MTRGRSKLDPPPLALGKAIARRMARRRKTQEIYAFTGQFAGARKEAFFIGNLKKRLSQTKPQIYAGHSMRYLSPETPRAVTGIVSCNEMV